MKKQNLIGKIFGRLTVISPGKSIKEGKNFKTTWNCACECGNVILAKTYNLNRGGVTSCGCLRDELRLKLKQNQKFGKLLTISYNGESVWKCQCDCGTICLVKSDKLSLGKTKSCGCIAKEVSKNNIKKAIKNRRKYTPQITSARRIWQNYCKIDHVSTKNHIISFDDFFELSQKPCHYCGSHPNNKFNLFKYKYYKGSDFSIKNGLFIYNGLDRIDNSKKHYKNNCVPCCIICNRAKNNRSYQDMINYMIKLSINNSYNLSYSLKEIPKELLITIRYIWKQNYNDGDINLELFYTLSQMPCFYCCNLFSNKYKNYTYNGLDRIDSSNLHLKNNVVPCCKFCNFAKSNLTIQEFNEWIIRAKNFNK